MRFFLGSVLVASISQIMLKKSADKKYDRWIDEYLNFRVIFAYGLFFLSSLLTVYAYKFVPLSLGLFWRPADIFLSQSWDILF